MITFANTGPLLRAAGYAPAPCDENTGLPMGPFAARQWPYDKHPGHDEFPVAVLTCLPPARNELENQNYRDTWLVTVRVSVRAELVAQVDALVKRHAGKARCPVLLGDDGPVYVFRATGLPGASDAMPATLDNWAGPGMSVRTDGNCAPDHVTVEVAPSYLPVGRGSWRDGVDLLSIARAELPELTPANADALVKEVNALLDKHAPPVVVRAPYAPKPLLEPGAELLFGNRRAIAHLRKHNYQPAPVLWGKNIRPRLDPSAAQLYDGYPTDELAWAECGVGLLANYRRPNVNFDRNPTKHGASWLAEVEVRCKRPEIMSAVDAIVLARLGQSPVRMGLDGQERLYLFKRQSALESVEFIRAAGLPGLPSVLGSTVKIRVALQDTILVSGHDVGGTPYRWERGTVLDVPHDDLPSLDKWSVTGFIQAAESLLESGQFRDAAPAPKRRKVAT